jgi:hypothetical protein
MSITTGVRLQLTTFYTAVSPHPLAQPVCALPSAAERTEGKDQIDKGSGDSRLNRCYDQFSLQAGRSFGSFGLCAPSLPSSLHV